MSDSAPPERTRDLERLLTFVDAIVAIAITLLVLPLAELAGEVGEGDSVWRTVRDHAGQFTGFALSFVVIARLWYAQHLIVRRAVDAPAPLVACLIGWTLTIVFLPFPSALLSTAGSQAATKVLYIGTLTLSAVMLTVLAQLVRGQVPASERPPRSSPSLLDAIALAAALVVSLLVPALHYFPVLLLAVSGVVEGRLERRRKRRRRQPGRA